MSILRLSISLLPLLLFASCGGQEAPTDTNPPADNPTTDNAPPALDAAVVAVLEKADAKDGTVDQVVHKCAGCSLGMNGKAEHSLEVGGYTMHFCKTGCLDAFTPDPSKAILAMKIKD